MTGQHALKRSELQLIGRSELESGALEMLPRPRLEVVAAVEDVAQPGRVLGVDHPVELNPAHALMADSAGAEVAAGLFRQ